MSTVTADAKSRISVPQAQPGDKFDLQIDAKGRIILVRLVSQSNKTPQKAPLIKSKIGKDGLPIVPAKIPKGTVAKIVREDRDCR